MIDTRDWHGGEQSPGTWKGSVVEGNRIKRRVTQTPSKRPLSAAVRVFGNGSAEAWSTSAQHFCRVSGWNFSKLNDDTRSPLCPFSKWPGGVAVFHRFSSFPVCRRKKSCAPPPTPHPSHRLAFCFQGLRLMFRLEWVLFVEGLIFPALFCRFSSMVCWFFFLAQDVALCSELNDKERSFWLIRVSLIFGGGGDLFPPNFFFNCWWQFPAVVDARFFFLLRCYGFTALSESLGSDLNGRRHPTGFRRLKPKTTPQWHRKVKKNQ